MHSKMLPGEHFAPPGEHFALEGEHFALEREHFAPRGAFCYGAFCSPWGAKCYPFRKSSKSPEILPQTLIFGLSRLPRLLYIDEDQEWTLLWQNFNFLSGGVTLILASRRRLTFGAI